MELKALRDTLRSFGGRFGFFSDSEIPVTQLQKRRDVQWVVPEGRVWPFFLDVIIPAHYQETFVGHDDVLSAAGREKSVHCEY